MNYKNLINHILHHKTIYLSVVCFPILFVIGLDYLLLSLAVWCFLVPLIVCTFHDYVSHDYYIPRNTLVKKVLIYLMMIYCLVSVKGKRVYHQNHHLYTDDVDKDPTRRRLDSTSTWRYMFDLFPPLDLRLEPIDILDGDIDHEWPNFDRQIPYLTAFWLMFLIILAIVNWKLVFVLYLFQILGINLASKYVDIYFHKYHRPDSGYMLLFFSDAAWHIQHHNDWRCEYHGTGFWSYLNLCSLYRKIFFKNKSPLS